VPRVPSQVHPMSSEMNIKACETNTLYFPSAPVPCLPHDSYNKGPTRHVVSTGSGSGRNATNQHPCRQSKMGRSWRSLTRHRAHPSGSRAEHRAPWNRESIWTPLLKRAGVRLLVMAVFAGILEGIFGPSPFLFMHHYSLSFSILPPVLCLAYVAMLDGSSRAGRRESPFPRLGHSGGLQNSSSSFVV
jgi:hypothetical protein